MKAYVGLDVSPTVHHSGKARNREVGIERTSNSDQPYSTEPRSVQGGFQPIWHKGLQGKIDSLPVRPRREISSVGLPRPDIIRCTKMDRVFLAITANDDTHSGEGGRVNGYSRGGQIERRLDKAAVILKTNIAGHAQTGAAINHAVRYRGLGDTAHDLVADTTPPGTQRGDKAVIGKVVDQHGAILRQGQCQSKSA